MAIYSAVPPPPESPPHPQGSAHHHHHAQHPDTTTPATPAALHQHSLSDASTATLDIEAWTLSALESLSVSPVARGTGTPLSIPLDDSHGHQQHRAALPLRTTSRHATGHGPDKGRDGAGMRLPGVAFHDDADDAGEPITPPRRPPSRRDSLRRREAILKGNEGSRQRRRWENARFMHVPNAQPPLPTDWVIHPTHPVHHVPYQLAQFWDKGLRQQAEQREHDRERAAAAGLLRRRRTQDRKSGMVVDHGAGRVPRELRATAKKTPAVKEWLRALEAPVRTFLVERGFGKEADKAVEDDDDDDDDDGDSVDAESDDDEEIVFVGRRGGMRDARPARKPSADWKRARREVGGASVEAGMVLDAAGNDESSAFKRWLTHSISDYYGLSSRSVDVGNPARRVVYIGLKQSGLRRQQPPLGAIDLPPPLWELF